MRDGGTGGDGAGGSGSNGNSTGLYALSVTDLLAHFVTADPVTGNGQVLPGTLASGAVKDYRVTVSDTALRVQTTEPSLASSAFRIPVPPSV